MVILPHPRYGDFYRFRLLFNSSLKGPSLENEERSLHQTWSVCYWSPMSMFGWVWNKSKIWPKMVILPHPRYGDFYRFRLLFNSSLKGPSLENEERSLHQTWSVCYWSPMSMFAWVWNKSKIWPKMVILPHPRYGDFYCFLTPPSQGPSLENKERSLHQTWSVCYWSPMSMFPWVSNKSKIWPKMVILPHPQYGDFYWFRLLFNSSQKRPYLENEERSLHQTWSVCYWSPMSMFGWVSNKSKIWPKMVILPHPRYGDFYGFRLLFNSSLKGPYLENEERSLHQTWSVCYWSPMSMFGWVWNKSKIWPKMVILPHPRYGDFYGFRLLFNSSLKGPSLENEERSLHQTWSVCYWSPMSMFGWVSNKSKIWPKMVILPHPRYGDFYRFRLLFNSSLKRQYVLSRTKRDLFTKLGQCATEAPCQCLVEFQTNPKFDPKWWFCPTRGMAIFTIISPAF